MFEFWRRAPAHAAAFVAVAGKARRTQWREGWFWQIGIIAALTLTLPVVLNARALAGPDESQAARFAAVAGTDNYLAFTAVGVVVMAWVTTTMQSVAVALAYERNLGTLGVAWSTLTPRILLLAADATGRALTQTWFGVVMFATLWVLVRFELTVVPAALVLVLLTALTTSIAVGVVMVGFIMRFRDAGMLSSTMIFASAILAGIAYPTTVLPEWAQAVGHALPITWVARGLRAALVYGDAAEAYLAAAVLLGMTLVLGVGGWRLFTRLDRATRRRGLLETF